MMNNFRGLQIAAKSLFYYQPMFPHITMLIAKRMVRGVDHYISILPKNLTALP